MMDGDEAALKTAVYKRHLEWKFFRGDQKEALKVGKWPKCESGLSSMKTQKGGYLARMIECGMSTFQSKR